jgi:hypothetical protein
MFLGQSAMGIESLIPFGFETDSGQIVDVGNVKRGYACGCTCPSCNTPLVARHGNEKEWHFAHRSQKIHNKTRKECKYSFAVSVRLMIRQLSSEGLKFRTPRFECSMPAYSEDSYNSADFPYLVTEESLLVMKEVQVGADFCGVAVDVLGLVEDVPFVVFVTYKERSLPSQLKNPSVLKCGVVELKVNAVPRLFKEQGNGQYKEVLRRYIQDETEGKTWVYHPREQRLRAAAFTKRQSWLRQEKSQSRTTISNKRHYQDTAKPRASISPALAHTALRRVLGNYTCVMCKSTWTGSSQICKTCDTHLFTIQQGE